MRPIPLASLVILGLLAGGSSAYAGRPHGPARPVSARAPAKSQPSPSWVVQGFGLEQEDAEQEALKAAKEKVLNYLSGQGVVLKWDPSLAFIRSLVKKIEPADDVDVQIAGIAPAKHVSVHFELSPQNYQYILKKESELRGQERMVILGKVLAGLVGILAAVAGYFRLEDATKGYYTAWLRLGAIGFVAMIGAGLWLLS